MQDADLEGFIEPDFESTLLNAFSLIHGSRNASYGPFAEDYQRVANVFGALTDWQPVTMTAELALLFMISMKISRTAFALSSGLAYSDPEMVKDSITDAAGYLDGLWITLNTPYSAETVEDSDEDEEDEDED
jgi:hypothetical protein